MKGLFNTQEMFVLTTKARACVSTFSFLAHKVKPQGKISPLHKGNKQLMCDYITPKTGIHVSFEYKTQKKNLTNPKAVLLN